MATLNELIAEFVANGFVLADAGNGCAYGDGRLVEYDEACAEMYGSIPLEKLNEPHMSADGAECQFASAWIIEGSGATHESGLVILFAPAADAAGAWDGQVVSNIQPTMALDAQALASADA